MKIRLSNYFLLSIFFFLAACSSCEVREKANKAGDVAGQVIGEFASGVSSGVEDAWETTVIPVESLKNQGIQFGKTTVSCDSIGKDNLLIVYIIFNQDFKGLLTAKAFDSKGLEMGRAKTRVAGKKDDAKFIEFHFDKRTNIDNDSKLTVE